MSMPYRTRRVLLRILTVLLVLVLVTVVVVGCWLLWLDRYVVYTRQDGAKLDFSLSEEVPEGELAVPPTQAEAPSIYYNSGEDAVNTSTELAQLLGYYADSAALKEDIGAVRSQVKTLPAGTAVMVDVKSIYGSFYYSSEVSTSRASDIDPAEMDKLIGELNSGVFYTIARLPALRDYEYGLNHVPDGLPTAGGYLWIDDDGCYWLNPQSQGTIAYLVQIVNELKALGFDEVVFSDFYFPQTDGIVFQGDKAQALTTAAETLLTTCGTDRFAVSFVDGGSFTLPEGRSRLYLEGVEAADVASRVEETGIADKAIRVVFLTEVHDTRFDAYSVLRPLAAAH